jgi:hypothetical protein
MLGVDSVLPHGVRVQERSRNEEVCPAKIARCVATGDHPQMCCIYRGMIRKLKSGQFRLYSKKKDESTGKRRNLGTFSTMEQAKQHEREVQYFKKH